MIIHIVQYVCGLTVSIQMNADYFQSLIISLAFVPESFGALSGSGFNSKVIWDGRFFFIQVTVTCIEAPLLI